MWTSTPIVFFFSSRRRHTRWPRDWSSDVCSSDLFWGAAGSFLVPDPADAQEQQAHSADPGDGPFEIGRASCRERVSSPVVAVALYKGVILLISYVIKWSLSRLVSA